MVSLSIRRLKELNLCEFFDFGVMGPNKESRQQFTPKRVKFQFRPYRSFTDNKICPKKSHCALEGYENWTCTDFFNFGLTCPNTEISPSLSNSVKFHFFFFFIKLLLNLWHFQSGLIDFRMTFQSVDIDFFLQFAILGTI